MKSSKNLVSNNLNETLQNIDKLSYELAKYLNLPSDDENPEENKQLLWAIPEKKTLTLVTNNALLANQLRYKQNDIMVFLNTHLNLSFNIFKIKVNVAEKVSKTKNTEKRFVISEKTHGLLSNLADEINDEKLSHVLRNMGNK